MPIQLASPGVYIQEVSSGVRTIAGVATSVAAYLGAASRGPINKATRIYSFADFERGFGGLSADSGVDRDSARCRGFRQRHSGSGRLHDRLSGQHFQHQLHPQ